MDARRDLAEVELMSPSRRDARGRASLVGGSEGIVKGL
jgi:hypothetical protein